MKINENQCKIISKSPNDTVVIGEILSENLPFGTTVALYGDLAAGKTTLSRSIFTHLGYEKQFSSPTYTIINEYTKPDAHAYHMDVYRLSVPDELDYTGYEDCFDDSELIVIEWAELIEQRLPRNKIVRIFIDRTNDENERIFEIQTDEGQLLSKLKEALRAYSCD